MAVEYIGNKTSEGASFGRSVTDLIGFYGKAPVAQITVTALTDGSTGTAAGP